MARYVLPLSSRAALDVSVAGGKAASLAWLVRRGYSVPPGFVVRADALAQISGTSQVSIPHAVAQEIRAAYAQIGGAVAVRSSMTAEDAANASFAGLLETYLGIQGEEAVLDRVAACWASHVSRRVNLYRDRIAADGLPPGVAGAPSMARAPGMAVAPAMAVVVQRMVAARAAGVAFSRDPVCGQRCVVIEAVPGLGDVLVAGTANPDRYIVDGRGALASMEPVDPAVPVLTADQALALARQVTQIAAARGSPQDIEWAWDGSQFFFLQCRPITALAGRRVYSNQMVADMAPGLIKPLVYSTVSLGKARAVFGRLFTELLGPSDYDFTLLLPRIHSRLYADMTLLSELLERAGLPPNFIEMMARDEQMDRRHAPHGRPPAMNLAALSATWRLTRVGLRYVAPADQIREFLARHDQEFAYFDAQDWPTAALPDLLAALERMIRVENETLFYGFIGQLSMMGRNRMLGAWTRRTAAGVDPGALVSGLVGLRALEPNLHLRVLAEMGNALDPASRSLLCVGDDAVIRARLLGAGGEPGRRLVTGVDAFLDRFGFLSTNGTDFSRRPWSEDPAAIWRAIGHLLDAPRSGGGEGSVASRFTAQQQALKNVPAAIRPFYRRLLTSTIEYIDLRERVSMVMSQDSCYLRRLFLELARRLVAEGKLAEPDDIFYLYWDEARTLAEGWMAGAEARACTHARRAEMEADALLDPPDVLAGGWDARQKRVAVPVSEFLSGIGGSAGVVSGTARVVLDPDALTAPARQDEILVVPFTDVSWTPLFPAIAGIVAETGGQLSHTSIIAREYGLPAVVSVKYATRVIHTGQPITVDGNRGRVYLHPEREGSQPA
jgi:phosphohistidine swiveling domain-containing protein